MATPPKRIFTNEELLANAGKYVKVNEAGTEFEGSDAPASGNALEFVAKLTKVVGVDPVIVSGSVVNSLSGTITLLDFQSLDCSFTINSTQPDFVNPEKVIVDGCFFNDDSTVGYPFAFYVSSDTQIIVIPIGATILGDPSGLLRCWVSVRINP